MNKKTLSVILIMVAVFLSVFLFGCKNNQIKFYRESQAESIINKFSQNKAHVNKSSGMIILRDESNNNSNIKFGPSDLNFDLPVKIK